MTATEILKKHGIKPSKTHELFQVLDHPGDIVSVIEKAMARWKAGWGKKAEGACV